MVKRACQWAPECFPLTRIPPKWTTSFKPSLYPIFESRKCTIKFYFEAVDQNGKEVRENICSPPARIEKKPTPKIRKLQFHDFLSCCGSISTNDDVDLGDLTRPLNSKSPKIFSIVISSSLDGLESSQLSRSISLTQVHPGFTNFFDQISYTPDFQSFIRPIVLPPRIAVKEKIRHVSRRKKAPIYAPREPSKQNNIPQTKTSQILLKNFL